MYIYIWLFVYKYDYLRVLNKVLLSFQNNKKNLINQREILNQVPTFLEAYNIKSLNTAFHYLC